jgi:hypothetical protein
MGDDLQLVGWDMYEMACIRYNSKSVCVAALLHDGVKFLMISPKDHAFRRFIVDNNGNTYKLTKLINMLTELRVSVLGGGGVVIGGSQHKKRKLQKNLDDRSKSAGVINVVLPSFQLGEKIINAVHTKMAHSDSGVLLQLDLVNVQWMFNRLKAMPDSPTKAKPLDVIEPSATTDTSTEAGTGGA